MVIGVPREMKNNENRVGLTPAGTHELVKRGHQVLIETHAGAASGFRNDDYEDAGAEIILTEDEVWGRAEMIIKVKEPEELEYKMARKDQLIFCFFHFASNRKLTHAMMDSGAVCLAYETVETTNKVLPILVPMSEVAGRMAIQQGARYLEKPVMGRGILLGGVPGVTPGKVLIIGAGIVGVQAAKMASGLGAHVTILDTNIQRLRYINDVLPPHVVTMFSSEYNIRQLVANHDLIVGAVLVTGEVSPKVITRDMLKLMRPGTVIVDVSVDQGGCIETCKPTTHENPTYIVDGILHYCVSNMPGAVPYTSTIALTNSTFPYIIELADKGWRKACLDNYELLKGLNIISGEVVYRGVAAAFDLHYKPVHLFLDPKQEVED
ncbi:alanine dehydrogenase [Pedobacter cryophilus]|uniref:Alanine dehydrogenase n=1 Tax=Pedobacter cryophilus TaxID=2571271 RepID=A0A4U1C5Z9_9SPHI|nr:alanine dehydrogenase [Pedobacter cryophilus]TKB98770.1 alanine dehydrogenase [Pedobacter cryophilus]